MSRNSVSPSPDTQTIGYSGVPVPNLVLAAQTISSAPIPAMTQGLSPAIGRASTPASIHASMSPSIFGVITLSAPPDAASVHAPPQAPNGGTTPAPAMTMIPTPSHPPAAPPAEDTTPIATSFLNRPAPSLQYFTSQIRKKNHTAEKLCAVWITVNAPMPDPLHAGQSMIQSVGDAAPFLRLLIEADIVWTKCKKIPMSMFISSISSIIPHLQSYMLIACV